MVLLKTLSLFLLLIFLGCGRDFDTSIDLGELSDEDRAWLLDGNKDGEADSILKYHGECRDFVSECLKKAKDGKSAIQLYWDFDENEGTEVSDQSPYGNAGAISGAAWGEGVSGPGLEFSGKEYVWVEEPGFLDIGSSSWSLSAWVKTSKLVQDFQDIISRDECGNSECGPDEQALYALSLFEKNAVFRIRSDNGNSLNISDTTVNIADDFWHHIVGVLNREDKTLKLYVDGKMRTSISAAYIDDISDSGSPLNLGRNFRSLPLEPRNYFTGSIDEVRIFSKALTDSDIETLWETFGG